MMLYSLLAKAGVRQSRDCWLDNVNRSLECMKLRFMRADMSFVSLQYCENSLGLSAHPFSHTPSSSRLHAGGTDIACRSGWSRVIGLVDRWRVDWYCTAGQ
jgi:hypothetical protein